MTRSATCGSSTSGRCWRLTDPDGVRRRRRADPRRAVRRARDPSVEQGRALAPGELLDALATRPDRASSTHARTARPAGAGPVVRPGDERPLVHHGAADGDVGPRPGRRRRARRRPAADRPPAPRRPHRRRRPPVQLRRQRPPAEPGARSASSSSARPGDVWTWGPDDAADRVTGPALDFCLLVTQRRHRDDVDVTVAGRCGDEWLGIAQAFAGPPGAGPSPRPVRLIDTSSEVAEDGEDLGGGDAVRRAELGEAGRGSR